MVYDINDKTIHPKYDVPKPTREKCLMALNDPCEVTRSLARQILNKLDRLEKLGKKEIVR